MMSLGTFLRCTVIAMLTVVAGVSACSLGDGDIEADGEPCVSDFDCPDTHECVQAESPNASRVCMPLP
jgi:hypothetical protein